MGLQFNVNTELQIREFYLLSVFLLEDCWEGSYISVRSKCLNWGLKLGLSSSKPTYNLLGYSDFKMKANEINALG